MKRSAKSDASFETLHAKLPRNANNIFYRDQIGNISSSDVQFGRDDISLDVSTRYPMFGGWKSQFYIGYSQPMPSEMSHVTLKNFFSNNEYSMKIDFFTIFQDVWVENLEIKIILPEGCNDINIDVPYPHDRSDSRRFTFLDSELNGGRPVITIKTTNAVQEHDQQITITYSLSPYRMVVGPLLFLITFFVIILIVATFSKLSSKLEGDSSSRRENVKED